MFGPVKVPESVKIIVITYCNFIRNALTDWLDRLSLSEFSKIIFMHDKAPTTCCQENQRIPLHIEIQRRIFNEVVSLFFRFESH